MKKILINIGITSVIIITFLYVLQFVVDKGLKKSNNQLLVSWSEIYNSKVNADVLINGSSRAVVMASPRIIDSALHVNSYNIGLNGWGWIMQKAHIDFYLAHNKKPKYILQALEPSFFETRVDLYDYTQFIPYLDDTIIRKATKGYKGSFTFPELYFPCFKYNNKISLMIEGLKSFMGKGAVSQKYKGFYAQDQPWNYSEFSAFKQTHPAGIPVQIDTNNVNSFRSFVSYCKKNDIKLVFEFPPIEHEGYLLISNRNEVMNLLKTIAAENQVPFLDYSDDPICYNKDYFYNAEHLNAKGVPPFNVKLAEDLKKYIRL